MGDTGYNDSSAIITDDPEQVRQAQQALIALGFDLGRGGADGDWGARSQAAAAEWQKINQYETMDGQITTRQLDVLKHQEQSPQAYDLQVENYNATQLQPFYQNFDTNKFSHLDPARAAILTQHAAHLGAVEDKPEGATEGNNSGAAVRQYITVDPRAREGMSWCASYGSWSMDQVERRAGIGKDGLMNPNMRVRELGDKIRKTTPEAFQSVRNYEPQGADAMLIRHDTGGGHYTTVVAAFKQDDGLYAVITIDGNKDDGVNIGEYFVIADEETGKNYIGIPDASGATIYPDYNTEVEIIDIEKLPNYDRINEAFNARSAPYIPTPSSDPNFKPDLESLSTLSDILDAYREQHGIFTLPTFDIRPDITNAPQMSSQGIEDDHAVKSSPTLPTFGGP